MRVVRGWRGGGAPEIVSGNCLVCGGGGGSGGGVTQFESMEHIDFRIG